VDPESAAALAHYVGVLRSYWRKPSDTPFLLGRIWLLSIVITETPSDRVLLTVATAQATQAKNK